MDELAARIIQEVETIESGAGVDLSPVKKLAAEMQQRAAEVTAFFIEQAA